MKELIKCLDGPLLDQEVYLDRRLMKLYDQIKVEEEEIYQPNKGPLKTRKIGVFHVYQISNDGLKFVGE